MEKTKGKPARKRTQAHNREERLKRSGDLRIALPMCAAEVDAKKKRVSNKPRAMLLVNDVLNPRDAESAALALCDLVGLLCEAHKKADRLELDFYCNVQAILYLEDWEEHLRTLLTAIRNQRAKKK